MGMFILGSGVLFFGIVLGMILGVGMMMTSYDKLLLKYGMVADRDNTTIEVVNEGVFMRETDLDIA